MEDEDPQPLSTGLRPPKHPQPLAQTQPNQKKKTYSVPELFGWTTSTSNTPTASVPISSSSKTRRAQSAKGQAPKPPQQFNQPKVGEVERFNLVERFVSLEKSVAGCEQEIREVKHTLFTISNKLDILFAALQLDSPNLRSPYPNNRSSPVRHLSEGDEAEDATTFVQVRRILEDRDCHNPVQDNVERTPAVAILHKKPTRIVAQGEPLPSPVLSEILQAKDFIQKNTGADSEGQTERVIIKKGKTGEHGTKMLSVFDLPTSPGDEILTAEATQFSDDEGSRGEGERGGERREGNANGLVMKEEALTQMTHKWMDSKREKENLFGQRRSRNGRRASMEDLDFIEEFLWREESLSEGSSSLGKGAGGDSSVNSSVSNSSNGGSGSKEAGESGSGTFVVLPPPISPRDRTHKRSNSVPSPSTTLTSSQFYGGAGGMMRAEEEGERVWYSKDSREREKENEKGKEKKSEREKGTEQEEHGADQGAGPHQHEMEKEEEEQERRITVVRHPPKWTYADTCFVCKKSFSTFLRRRHHCRNCGEACCDGCSMHTLPLPHYRVHRPQRVCKHCHSLLSTNHDGL